MPKVVKSDLKNPTNLPAKCAYCLRFPSPLKVKCFKCSKTFEIKYVVPNKAYSKKNNWEYWTNPHWKNQKTQKDRQICNACLLAFYYDKETYWATMKDLKKRQKLRTYIYEKKITA